MENNESKLSQHDADDRNPDEHERHTNEEKAAGDAVKFKEELPYMEQFYHPEQSGQEDGEFEEDERVRAEALTGTAALVPAETVALTDSDSLTGSEQDALQSGEIDESDSAFEMEAEELNQVIEDICRSKAEEFRMLGYEQVTGREIWECVSDKYNKTGIPPLHRIVNDILSLKVTQFMNWMTMSIYKETPFR